MSEYSHCSICGGSFVGIGNVCPGCEHALSREPLEIRQVERPTRKNSETVRAIISEARGVFDELLKHGYAVVSIDRMADIIDRIIAAHDREIGELKGERKGLLKANEAFAADNTRLRGEVAAKDAEIEKLKKENACLRVINCGQYYSECNLREEILRLRELVEGTSQCR